MADPRTFTLIGEFKDGITPELEKINKQLASLKSSFGNIGGKGARNASKDMGRFSASVSSLVDNLKLQNQALKSAAMPLREYRTEIKRTTSALERLNAAGGNTSGLNATNRALTEQLRLMRAVGSAGGNRQRMIPRTPGGGGGGGGGGRGGGGMRTKGFGGNGDLGSYMAEFGFSLTLGNAIAQPIQNAVVKGFQIGVGLMTKPFQYFADAFGERIKDEMTDIQSAGGLYAMDKRKNLGLFETFQDARRQQEKINYLLSRSAAALPGTNAEYVQEAKKVTDTMIGALAKSPKEFTKFGEELGAKPGDKMASLETIIQKFTEKAVLLGKGSGGQSRMYGMPQLLEMLVNAPNVNVQAMGAKYAVMRGNPMLTQALKDAEDKIAKTGAGTADRLREIMKVLDAALPNEVIQGMKNSMEGVIQSIRASFLDPEMGLFGLGRKIKKMGKKVDQYGRYIDEKGQVTRDLAKAAEADLSLFDVVKDILGGFALPLSELAQILPEIFDPLKPIIKSMLKIRGVAQEFYASFNEYTAAFEDLAKKIGGKDQLRMKETAGARGALLAVANLMRAMGAINMAKFDDIAKQLQNVNVDLSAMTGSLLNTFLDSDAMVLIGQTIGTVIGTVLTQVAGATGFVAGRLKSSSKLLEALKTGFNSAGGTAAFKNIFKDVFHIMFSLLRKIATIIPFEAYMLAAAMVVIPAAIQSLAFKFAGLLMGGIETVFGLAGVSVRAAFARMAVPALATPGLTASLGMNAAYLTGGATAGAGAAAAGGGIGASLMGVLGVIGQGLTALAPLMLPLAATLAGIIVLGGGVQNTLRQLSQFFGEVMHNLGGIFGGFFDTLGVLGGFVLDVLRRLGEGLGGLLAMTGLVSKGFDGLKIVLAIITLPLQAISQGLRGLALALAELRVFIAKFTGDPEYKQRVKERDELKLKYQEDRGRINAYNATMQGPEAVRKQRNDALYLLQNAPKLDKARAAELRAFLKDTEGGNPNAPKPGATTTPKTGNPPAVLGNVPSVAPTVPVVSAPQIAATATATAATAAATGQISQKAGVQIAQNTQTNTTLGTIKSAMVALSNKLNATIQNGNMAIVGAINNAAASGGFGGMGPGGFSPPLGGAQGSLGNAANLASAAGLQMTSSFRPGDKGYHGVGRAMDFSNSTGPTPQMMAFAQHMVGKYGSSLSELIYSPLGFSIKDGRKVPPLAYGSHFNHVHVAYALGAGNGVAFNSLKGAQSWENSMMPGSVKVASITGNSREGFGGNTFGDINVTVNGSSSDPNQLASLVAVKVAEMIDDAVADRRATSLLV